MARAVGTKKRRRWPIVVAVLAALAVVAVLGLRYLAQKQMAALAPKPEVATATRTDQQAIASANGSSQPRSPGYLSFATPGKVTSVKVAVGDKVKADDPLATVEDESLRSAVTVARAQVDAAQEQLNQALDDNTSNAAISAARAQVESAQQQVKVAEKALDAATLRSTIDGTVAAVNVKKGEQSGQGSSATDTSSYNDMGGLPGGYGGNSSGGTAGTSAANADIVVVRPGSWIVEADVNSNDIARIKKGQRVAVRADGSTAELRGKGRTVGVIGGQSNGTVTFPVTITLKGKPKNIFIGGTNTADIVVKKYQGVLTIPTAAIASKDGKTVVTKLVDGQPTEVPITMGETFGALTEVTDGLTEGDQVQYFPGQG